MIEAARILVAVDVVPIVVERVKVHVDMAALGDAPEVPFLRHTNERD